MHPPEITTACPSCDQRIAVDDPSPAGGSLYPSWDARTTAIEVECPMCGWGFAVDEEGRITDDGGLDPEGPFEVGPEGELVSENLLPATCPACGRRFQVGEAGVTQCPGCRQRFAVEDATVSVPAGAPGPEEGDEDEFGEDAFLCPACGSDGDLDGAGFLPLDLGWVICQGCGWEFHCKELFQELFTWQREEQNLRRTADQRLVVAADGSGDCPNLGRALEQVRDGGVILIRPGIYPTWPLQIARQHVTLQGDGPAEEIRLTGGLDVIASRLRLQNLTLTRAIQAHRSRLQMMDCLLCGSEQAGLEATGPGSQIRLQKCRIEACRAFGIRATPGTVLRLSGCTLACNGEGGVQAEDGAWVRLRSCQIVGNGGDGIRAGSHSSLILHRCAVANNDGSGISLHGSRAILTGCQILNQTGAGVLLDRHGCLLLRRCAVRQGQSYGLQFGQRTRALVSACEVTANALGGVSIGARARVVLARCSVQGNEGTGIRLSSSGRLSLRGCVCRTNRAEDWNIEPGGCIRIGWPAEH